MVGSEEKLDQIGTAPAMIAHRPDLRRLGREGGKSESLAWI